MTQQEETEVLVTAALLRAGALLPWLAVGLTTLCTTALVLRLSFLPALVGAASGLAAIYYGVRVAFDAKLFEEIAAQRVTTEDLDRALMAFGKQGDKRNWLARCHGARGLVARLAIACVAQLVAAVLMRWS
jgi:hypothetical protein